MKITSPAVLAGFFAALSSPLAAAEVRTERVPEGGVQPQITTGANGALQLIYQRGPAGGGEIRHAMKKPGVQTWSPAVTVNSIPATAVAAGTIRGAQIAIGREGSLHVVWNGAGKKDIPSPLYYARSLDGGQTFEPQRDLLGNTRGLDGGASIAASIEGGIFIVWHGASPGPEQGEVRRVVYVLKSTDNGRSFAAAKIVNADDLGVCACCSLKSYVTPKGELLTLYRAARRVDQRDVTLLSSKDGGETFTHRIIGPWAVNMCPMSSMTMTPALSGTSIRAAWEQDGRVLTALLSPDATNVAVSDGKGRHPALAVNSKGETLVSWSVGTGWQQGGSLSWTVLDGQGEATGQRGTAPGMPVWGMSAAYAEGDAFVVMY